MENTKIVLSENLVASSRGKVLDKYYRAVLIQQPADEYSPNGNGDVIAIEQPFDDHWGATGGCWYAEDLLKRRTDSIYMDGGQGWLINSGMLAALDQYEVRRSLDETNNVELVKCDNCGDVTTGDNLLPLGEIKDLPMRLDVGSEVPAGECLDCGAFSYVVEGGAA